MARVIEVRSVGLSGTPSTYSPFGARARQSLPYNALARGDRCAACTPSRMTSHYPIPAPSITTCGSGIPCMVQSKQAGLRGLGRYGTVGCSELDTSISNLGIALKQAEDAGLTAIGAYTSAKPFYDQETGFFSQTTVSWGSDCANKVKMANDALNALNAALAGAGVPGASLVAPPDYVVPPGADTGITSMIKWVAVAAAVVAGAFVLGPIAQRLFR